MSEQLEETRANTEYIRNKGYNVVERWEFTEVHQVVEFTSEPCFKPFGDAVSDARRAGDADPRRAIIADTMKLVSAQFWLRKTITNQLKHRNVEYCSDAKASRKVNTPLFRKLDILTDETYEVERRMK
ncbi:unnamed protein product [Porites lobata]|uniref:Uncharacterized protein n=1 Tax=Porites lobata TaxID=104759 RepID=A0ABN8RF29_9CNID|nr:unnamed protein product [Porites lobata]